MKRKIYNFLKAPYKFLFKKYSDQDKLQILLRRIIKETKKKKEEFFFIQIGSNDGKTGDPLFNLVIKYNLKGILVEPIPYLFERLKSNYKNKKNVFFENAAIGKPDQNLKFYRLKETPGLPNWHNQLGSFRKEIILNHIGDIPNIKDLIVEENIKVIKFEDLLSTYSVSHVSLLQIDAEGYDYEIIKNINFSNCPINYILFEYKHLSPDEYINCMNYLKSNGFHCMEEYSGDTFCGRIKALEIS